VRAVFETILSLKEELNLKVTTVLSRAGHGIARLYGVLDRLRAVSPGSYYEELIVEDLLRPTSKIPGRVMTGSYDAVAIAPATANTVAKMAHGIADTLVTQAFSMAGKSGTPIVVLPSDHSEAVEAELPCTVDPEACRACPECPPELSCPQKAVYRLEDRTARIDLALCRGCEACVPLCPHGAISCWRKVVLRCRELDLANVRTLEAMPGVYVVRSEDELYEVLRRLLSG